jgi:hypothetical protein
MACPLTATTTGLGKAKSVPTNRERRGETPGVVRAFSREPEQIHSRGEDRPCARQDEGTDVLCDAVEFAQ